MAYYFLSFWTTLFVLLCLFIRQPNELKELVDHGDRDSSKNTEPKESFMSR